MRFTSVALAILLVALTGVDAARGALQIQIAYSGYENPTAPVTDMDGLPIAVLRSASGDGEKARLRSEGEAHRDHPSAAGRDGSAEARTRKALVHLRAMGRVELDFTPRLNRTLTGFFSSYTTVCPPPGV